uniref:Uncharacterized protein n=1 Tax=Knipowitschia caucasica TaxID=637954 RepID=A0AAV2MFA5_KNICA
MGPGGVRGQLWTCPGPDRDLLWTCSGPAVDLPWTSWPVCLVVHSPTTETHNTLDFLLVDLPLWRRLKRWLSSVCRYTHYYSPKYCHAKVYCPLKLYSPGQQRFLQ